MAKTRKRHKFNTPFEPLRQAIAQGAYPEPVIEEAMRLYTCPRDIAIAMLDREEAGCEYWLNDLYQVQKTPLPDGAFQLNIRRRDGGVIYRDWRHFQAIKNQLCGEEIEGVEIYPAESRKVDTSNKYHIWCLPPGLKVPFGWDERHVESTAALGPEVAPGLRQRGE